LHIFSPLFSPYGSSSLRLDSGDIAGRYGLLITTLIKLFEIFSLRMDFHGKNREKFGRGKVVDWG